MLVNKVYHKHKAVYVQDRTGQDTESGAVMIAATRHHRYVFKTSQRGGALCDGLLLQQPARGWHVLSATTAPADCADSDLGSVHTQIVIIRGRGERVNVCNCHNAMQHSREPHLGPIRIESLAFCSATGGPKPGAHADASIQRPHSPRAHGVAGLGHGNEQRWLLFNWTPCVRAQDQHPALFLRVVPRVGVICQVLPCPKDQRREIVQVDPTGLLRCRSKALAVALVREEDLRGTVDGMQGHHDICEQGENLDG